MGVQSMRVLCFKGLGLRLRRDSSVEDQRVYGLVVSKPTEPKRYSSINPETHKPQTGKPINPDPLHPKPLKP